MSELMRNPYQFSKYEAPSFRAGRFTNNDYAVLVQRSSFNGGSFVKSIETWKIKENELDIQVAVRVENGLVQEVFANADVQVEVYDLYSPDFLKDEEMVEIDEKKKEWSEETQKPGWCQVW